MKFSSVYNLRTPDFIPGAHCCLAIGDIFATEYVAGQASGTGIGTPDATTGALQPGTIVAGVPVMLDGNGTWVPATSPNLSSALAILIGWTHEGDNDLSGAFVGRLTVLCGMGRIDTGAYNTSDVYTPGTQLYVSAGVFLPKAQGDDNQPVGFVGPEGLRTTALGTALDVIMWPASNL